MTFVNEWKEGKKEKMYLKEKNLYVAKNDKK